MNNKEIVELNKHLQANNYDYKYDFVNQQLICKSDDLSYIETMLDERNIDYDVLKNNDDFDLEKE